MSIEGIGKSGLEKIKGYSFIEESIKKKSQDVSTDGDFGSILKSAIDTLNETSKLEQEAQKLQVDYITGKTDDMLAVVMAEQKAYTSLNFTVQVTNKVVEAYRQIISMQI